MFHLWLLPLLAVPRRSPFKRSRSGRVSFTVFAVIGRPTPFLVVPQRLRHYMCNFLNIWARKILKTVLKILHLFSNVAYQAIFHLRFLPLLAVPSRFWRSHTVIGTKCVTFVIFGLEKFKDSFGNLTSNVANLAVFRLRLLPLLAVPRRFRWSHTVLRH